jgi:hypothetical protein
MIYSIGLFNDQSSASSSDAGSKQRVFDHFQHFFQWSEERRYKEQVTLIINRMKKKVAHFATYIDRMNTTSYVG